MNIKKNICKFPFYVKLFSLIFNIPYDHIWYIHFVHIATPTQIDDTRQTVLMDRSLSRQHKYITTERELLNNSMGYPINKSNIFHILTNNSENVTKTNLWIHDGIINDTWNAVTSGASGLTTSDWLYVRDIGSFVLSLFCACLHFCIFLCQNRLFTHLWIEYP